MTTRRLFVAVDKAGGLHTKSTVRRGFLFCVVARLPKVDHIRLGAVGDDTFQAKAWTHQPHLARHQFKRWQQVFEEVDVLPVKEADGSHG